MILGGRVIASDSTGNIYKTVYLRDATSAVAIAVDTTKLYLRFKEGEEMFIDVTGLYAGKYNGLFQIGLREAYGSGYETSQMPGSMFYDKTHLNGLPARRDRHYRHHPRPHQGVGTQPGQHSPLCRAAREARQCCF